jgi:hypothetical protein
MSARSPHASVDTMIKKFLPELFKMQGAPEAPDCLRWQQEQRRHGNPEWSFQNGLRRGRLA